LEAAILPKRERRARNGAVRIKAVLRLPHPNQYRPHSKLTPAADISMHSHTWMPRRRFGWGEVSQRRDMEFGAGGGYPCQRHSAVMFTGRRSGNRR
jgi:hypothetical protein